MAPATRSMTNGHGAKGYIIYGRPKRCECEVKVAPKKTKKTTRKRKIVSKLGKGNTRSAYPLPGKTLSKSQKIYVGNLIKIGATAVVEIEDCCTQLGWPNKLTKRQRDVPQNLKHEPKPTIADQAELKREKASVQVRMSDWPSMGVRGGQIPEDCDSLVEKLASIKRTGPLKVDTATQFPEKKVDVGSMTFFVFQARESETVKSDWSGDSVQIPEDSVADQLDLTQNEKLSMPTRTGRRRCLSDSVLTYLNGSGCSGIPEHDFDARHLIEHRWAGPLMVDTAIQLPEDEVVGRPLSVIGFQDINADINPNLSGLLIGEQGSPECFSPNMNYFSTPLDDTAVEERSTGMDSPELRFQSILSALELPPVPVHLGQKFRWESMNCLLEPSDGMFSLNPLRYDKIDGALADDIDDNQLEE